MIVYYTADQEKSETADDVKFYLDHSSAQDAALQERKLVFQFEVNEKCDTNSFDRDTLMLFRRDHDTGELKFLCSGRWSEIHEIMNIPFYVDFEQRSNVYVSMSLKYFNDNYKIVPLTEALSVNAPAPRKRVKTKCEVKSMPVTENVTTGQNQGVSDTQDVDPDIISMLFEGF